MTSRLIIRNARIMAGNPAREITGDLLLEEGKITRIGAIGNPAGAAEEIDAAGKYALPGLVDPHTHYIEDKESGYKMLIAAGVTTALDTIVISGDTTRHAVANNTGGVNCAAFYLLKPDRTVPGTDPSRDDLAKAMAASRTEGLYGLKIAGAHFPFSPEANARAIALAAEMQLPLMIHAGSLTATDDLKGMRQIVECAAGNPFILAHINVYCNGKCGGDDLEAAQAIEMLNANPRIVCESTFNVYGSIGTRMINDVPESLCMREMLTDNGFEPTYQGLLAALESGKFQASGKVDWAYRILPPEQGVALCKEKHGQVTVRTVCHRESANLAILTAKRADGRFTVTSFSTDGGIIPANIVLEKGLEQVAAGRFTLAEFVHQSAAAGAMMLGLDGRKGVIAEGADADVILVDLAARVPDYTISGGQVAYHAGQFLPVPNTYLAAPDHTPAWLLG